MAEQKPPHRGRLQAQGKGPTQRHGCEESVPWARDEPPTKTEMLEFLKQLWGMLSRSEQEEREVCREKMEAFIREAPASGYDEIPSKSFRNPKMKGGVRLDIEINKGKACVDDDYDESA